MAQWLRALIALVEHQDSIPSTHTVWLTTIPNSSSRGSDIPCWPLGAPDTHMVHIHPHRRNSHKTILNNYRIIFSKRTTEYKSRWFWWSKSFVPAGQVLCYCAAPPATPDLHMTQHASLHSWNWICKSDFLVLLGYIPSLRIVGIGPGGGGARL